MPVHESTGARKGGPVISRIFVLSAVFLFSSSCISAARGQGSPVAAPPPAASRSQSDSLGDAARQARAQKPHSAKPAKVFTNDDVHGLKDSFSEKGRGKHSSRTSSAKPPSPR